MTKRLIFPSGHYALVDDADYAHLRQFRWHRSTNGYAMGSVKRSGQRQKVYMHRYLMDAQPGDIVDHIDGNKLNNTRANLRIVSNAQNQWNRRPQANATGYKGVTWHKRKQKYHARIQVNGQRYSLGYFDTARAAAEAYNAAAKLHFGEYRRCTPLRDR